MPDTQQVVNDPTMVPLAANNDDIFTDEFGTFIIVSSTLSSRGNNPRRNRKWLSLKSIYARGK